MNNRNEHVNVKDINKFPNSYFSLFLVKRVFVNPEQNLNRNLFKLPAVAYHSSITFAYCGIVEHSSLWSNIKLKFYLYFLVCFIVIKKLMLNTNIIYTLHASAYFQENNVFSNPQQRNRNLTKYHTVAYPTLITFVYCDITVHSSNSANIRFKFDLSFWYV